MSSHPWTLLWVIAPCLCMPPLSLWTTKESEADVPWQKWGQLNPVASKFHHITLSFGDYVNPTISQKFSSVSRFQSRNTKHTQKLGFRTIWVKTKNTNRFQPQSPKFLAPPLHGIIECLRGILIGSQIITVQGTGIWTRYATSQNCGTVGVVFYRLQY